MSRMQIKASMRQTQQSDLAEQNQSLISSSFLGKGLRKLECKPFPCSSNLKRVQIKAIFCRKEGKIYTLLLGKGFGCIWVHVQCNHSKGHAAADARFPYLRAFNAPPYRDHISQGHHLGGGTRRCCQASCFCLWLFIRKSRIGQMHLPITKCSCRSG